ncbi:hypothetical protein PHMEG_00016539 [Phytophthora megakarya]|uniref:Uncharacterized protein n=1 Tax=Phytophthora megakarya TaxID=4795 RepID=A0A225VZ21_9STRA|nr:hypothetical protein PHMEG_00016539 [Phytophthora megakarya]
MTTILQLLFALGLGRGRMHVDALDSSSTTPPKVTPRMPMTAPQYFGQQYVLNVRIGTVVPGSIPKRAFEVSGRAPEEAGERAMDGERLNIGLGSVVLEWGHRFERQVAFAKSSCRLMWQVDIAEPYYKKQIDAWWKQLRMLHYVMERRLEAFKTNLTLVQAMKLFTASKDSRSCGGGTDYLVLNNIVQLIAKMDEDRLDYVKPTNGLAHFAQTWMMEPAK